MGQFTRLPQSTFLILFLITLASFAWLHWTVMKMLREAMPQLENYFELRQEAKSIPVK